MRIFKKTLILQLPMWLLLILEASAVLLVAVVIIMQTSIPKTLQLRTLRPDKVAGAQLTYSSHWRPVQEASLTEEDIAAAVKLINQVSLPGKPYELTFIGAGPEYLTFSLTDGTVLKFGVMSSSDYFYWIDEEYYYICSDGTFAGEGVPHKGVDRYPGDLELYDRWIALYENLCVKHFGEDYDQRPAQ